MKYDATSKNTKKMFAESLKKAMKKKAFSKITVSEIVRDCGVNRKTFYYHFEDIYGLLKWMLEEEAFEIVKKFDLLTNIEEAIDFVVDYVEQNDHMLNCVYDSLGRDQMKAFFVEDFLIICGKLISSLEQKTGIELEPQYKKYLCEFLSEAIAGMLINIFKGPQEYDRQKYKEYIVKTIETFLRGIFEFGTGQI